jgi:NTP pyrophosphatase (non-canonical NTP hydrolase)
MIIRKERKPVVLTANTIIQTEDRVIAVTAAESEEVLRATLRGT